MIWEPANRAKTNGGPAGDSALLLLDQSYGGRQEAVVILNY